MCQIGTYYLLREAGVLGGACLGFDAKSDFQWAMVKDPSAAKRYFSRDEAETDIETFSARFGPLEVNARTWII